MQDEEEKSSSKASKAAQKRARKKAAAKQAAGDEVAPPPPAAAATAAPISAGVSQQQPRSGALGDAQNRTPERSISGTAADVQQLDLDAASERTVASSPPAAPSGQQSADDWMICPLPKVSGNSNWSSIREARFCGVSQQDHVVSDAQQDHVVSAMQVVMEDPVMCSDGHTYSRAAITAWLDANGAISPLTSQPLARAELIPNHALRNTIEAVLQHTR
jgi:U-box domain